MKLQEYAKTQINLPPGFPEGDTLVDLPEADFEDIKFRDKDGKEQTITKIKTNGKEYRCPVSVFRALKKIDEAGGKKARITKTGTKMEDTKYTVIEIK